MASYDDALPLSNSQRGGHTGGMKTTLGATASVGGPLACLLAAALTAGCSAITADQIEDLGSTSSSTVGTAPAEPTAQFFTPYSDFYGTWIGEAADVLALDLGSGGSPPVYRFPSGSSQIAVTLEPLDPREDESDTDVNDTITGTVTFGAGTLPAPPTAADERYPVSYVDLLGSYSGSPAQLVAGDTKPLPPFEGFAYTTFQDFFASENGTSAQLEEFGAGVADGVLRLSILMTQILEPWCALQTPLLTQYGDFRCTVAPGGLAYDSVRDVCDVVAIVGETPLVKVDCNQLYLCGGYGPEILGRCECTSTSCYPSDERTLPDQDLDMHLRRRGDTLVGVFEESAFLNERGQRVPLGQVTLRRAE